jgi:hypothetical protein
MPQQLAPGSMASPRWYAIGGKSMELAARECAAGTYGAGLIREVNEVQQ